jgi:calcium-translocating P-type ATPase
VGEAHRGAVEHCGLTSAEVVEIRRASGPNALPVARRRAWWRQLLGQFGHFFARLLWGAGLLAVLGGVVELGLAIFAVIVVNGVFAFVQEHRAERASDRLRELVPRRVVVHRDGRRGEIDVVDLVPGDVVELSAGSRISADMEVVEANALVVDESVLTGESEPVFVDGGGAVRAGSFLVEGEGIAVVSAIGAATELGQVASLTRSVRRPPTPLAKELQRLVRTVAVIAVVTGASFFVLMVSLLGTAPSDGFVFAVGITVALVPEGLLPTVTLALSVGAQRMARDHALVRRLESVETLGSTTFICTDKTGTLTENRMNVVVVWTPSGEVEVAGSGYEPVARIEGSHEAVAAASRLAELARGTRGAVRTDGTWVASGDPVEAALDVLARRLGGAEGGPVPLRSFPFDPRRRRSSVVVGPMIRVKGAPDAVLPLCLGDVGDARRAHDRLAASGWRVMAVAVRSVDLAELPDDASAAERDLELVGLVALSDPPRVGTREALARCRSAGIKVGMITGDHRLTAVSVADAVGLRHPDSPVCSGADLPQDQDELGRLVDQDGIVVFRVTPADKLRIAGALQARGHVVAMTGDGVNDGPALQAADIGVAMGRTGTDVAREAADLVLLDDDFSTIVNAVELGRATFLNARQFLTYHLTDNVAELTPFLLWAATGGRFPLALGVLQILALDLGSHLRHGGARSDRQRVRVSPSVRVGVVATRVREPTPGPRRDGRVAVRRRSPVRGAGCSVPGPRIPTARRLAGGRPLGAGRPPRRRGGQTAGRTDRSQMRRVRRLSITPVTNPASWSPPQNRACSILRQRSCTTWSPAALAARAASSCTSPSWNHTERASTSIDSSTTSGRSSIRRKTSTMSGGPGRSASDGYTGWPRISVSRGLTYHTVQSVFPAR